MNRLISEYFARLEERLILSPMVASYETIRREISTSDGKIGLRISLTTKRTPESVHTWVGSTIELFEYVQEISNKIELIKYSFHWQSQDGTLINRWDNAPHHKEFQTAAHVHYPNGSVSADLKPYNALEILDMIERGHGR